MSRVKKNPFICFALQRKREMEAKGVSFPNGLQSAVEMFGPEWQKMKPADRQPYREQAKTGRIRASSGPSTSTSASPVKNDPYDFIKEEERMQENWKNMKTTLGITLGEIVADEVNEIILDERRRVQTLKIFERDGPDGLPHLSEDLESQRFLIIDFNLYAHCPDKTYIPAEIGLVAFSLEDGVVQSYSSLIDPGVIPTGLAAEVKRQCNANGNPRPGFGNGCDNYRRILRVLDEFIKMNPTHTDDPEGPFTFLFCLRQEMDKVQGCLNWLINKCELDRKYNLGSISAVLQLMARFGKVNYLCHLEVTEDIKRTKLLNKMLEEKRARNNPNDKTTVELVVTGYEIYGPGVDPTISPCLPGFPIDDGRNRARRIPHTYSHMMLAPPVYQYTANVGEPDETLGKVPENRSTYSNGSPRCSKRFTKSIASIYNEEKMEDGPVPDSQLFMYENSAEEFLQSLDLAFCYELACEHHGTHQVAIPTCPLNVVQRMAYNIIDVIIGYFPAIHPVEGSHYPLIEPEAEAQKRHEEQMYWRRPSYDLEGFFVPPDPVEPWEEDAQPRYGVRLG